MLQGDIENRPMACTTCGAGPWNGQESQSTDREGNVIVECTWVCGRCGSRFASGIVRVIPAKPDENKEAGN